MITRNHEFIVFAEQFQWLVIDESSIKTDWFDLSGILKFTKSFTLHDHLSYFLCPLKKEKQKVI